MQSRNLFDNPKHVEYAESVEVVASNEGDMWVNIDGKTVLYIERARKVEIRAEGFDADTKAKG